MTDIYYNGKKLQRIDLTFDGAAPPIITPEPPVDDKPPVRFVEPQPEETLPPSHVIMRQYGPLLRNNPSLMDHLRLGKVYSYGWSVPANSVVRLVTFGFVPQNLNLTQLAVWISKTPGGEALDERYALDSQTTRVGAQMAVTAAIRGRGGERRGAVIDTDTQYYINMQAGGPVPMKWRISGDF
jgi:hypothetical protein